MLERMARLGAELRIKELQAEERELVAFLKALDRAALPEPSPGWWRRQPRRPTRATATLSLAARRKRFLQKVAEMRKLVRAA
jgi:hypothetical protein